MRKVAVFFLSLITSVCCSFAQANQPSCQLQMTHYSRVAANLVELNSSLTRSLNSLEIASMADLAQAVMSFRPKSDADTDRVYRLFSGLNVTDPMKDAARKSDTLFSENKMLVEQLTAQGLGPEELQSLKAHLALASLISAELRLPSESLELPEITSAHNDQQVLGYRLAELVLEQHSLCLASPGSCHDYIKMLGALWTQFSSVPSAESHLFPRPAASVEGAYMVGFELIKPIVQ